MYGKIQLYSLDKKLVKGEFFKRIKTNFLFVSNAGNTQF